MIQLIIAGVVALALVASIWKVYDAGGDSREEAISARISAQREELRIQKERHEGAMRTFAESITKNWLDFQKRQGTYYTGVKNAITEEIRRSPALQRACLDAGSVQRFNAVSPGRPDGGTLPTPAPLDAERGGPAAAPAPRKPPGR